MNSLTANVAVGAAALVGVPYALLKAWQAIARRTMPVREVGLPWAPRAAVNKTVCIIGSGLSGIQAAKQAIADGWNVVIFEERDHVGGLWNFQDKQSMDEPTVYQSTHVDTGRDLNSFGDVPVPLDCAVLLSNADVTAYLNSNVDRFGLMRFVELRRKVLSVSPIDATVADDARGFVRWRVHSRSLKDNSERNDEFDAVLFCTGRHSHPYVARFPGDERFRGQIVHSAIYKNPKANRVDRGVVCVVGAGNSGVDLACEISEEARVIWVARSGAWVPDMKGVPLNAMGDGGSWLASLRGRIPWQWLDRFVAKQFFRPDKPVGDQQLLNDAGLTPTAGFVRSHPTVTGLIGKHTVHEQIKSGRIVVKRSIHHFTERGIVFEDENGVPEENETLVDSVVLATGFKQSAVVDPRVVDLRAERVDNHVDLHLCIFPFEERFSSLGFCNFVQSASFMCADMQMRLFFAVQRGEIVLPPRAERERQTKLTQQTLAKRWLDRQRHRIQHGIEFRYYDHLARVLGVDPTLWRLLSERPTAVWHGLFAPVCALTYRLVGTGATIAAERELELRAEDMARGWMGARLGATRTPQIVEIAIVRTLLLVAQLCGHYTAREQFDERLSSSI
jgi:dimethylaniline monooxygenase (N-oxide forming)